MFISKKIGFIVDTFSGINEGEISDVKVVPLEITIQEGDKIKSLKDNVDIDTNFLIKKFKENPNINVKTAQASLSSLYKIVDQMCLTYDYVIALPIQKCISGSINAWNLLKNDYKNLLVISSNDMCYSYSFTIEKIKEFLLSHSVDENSLQNYVNENINPYRLGLLMPTDLSFLVKGGRVSKFKAKIANFFKIKPVIRFNTNGLIQFSKAKNVADFVDIFQKLLNTEFKEKNAEIKYVTIIVDDPSNKQLFNEFTMKFPFVKLVQKIPPLTLISHTGLNAMSIVAILDKQR